MQYFQKTKTPLGILFLVEKDGFLTHITTKPITFSSNKKEEKTPLLKETIRQLQEYFSNKRICFSLPLAPNGTDFQAKVWEAVLEIPFGETRTYQDIAKKIQKPNASRAVGGAIGKNPLLVLIPCHRVIGTNGNLTGFSAGIEQKKHLLTLENIIK